MTEPRAAAAGLSLLLDALRRIHQRLPHCPISHHFLADSGDRLVAGSGSRADARGRS